MGHTVHLGRMVAFTVPARKRVAMTARNFMLICSAAGGHYGCLLYATTLTRLSGRLMPAFRYLPAQGVHRGYWRSNS